MTEGRTGPGRSPDVKAAASRPVAPARPSGTPEPAASAPRWGRWAAVLAFAGFLATLLAAVLVHPAVLVLHGFCALAAAVLAPARNRRPYVWLHAGLAFGVYALVEVVRRRARVVPPPGTVETGVAFAGVLDFMVLCGLAQVIVEDRILPNGMQTRPAVVALFCLFLLSAGALVWVNRASLFRYLTSVKTSVTLVTYLGIASFLMTMILQQPDAEEAYRQDQALLNTKVDAQGRPMDDVRREYVKFMAAETALVYGITHLFEGPPPPTKLQQEYERRLQATYGPTQGHNIAVREAASRERQRKRLEQQRLADETGDGLWGFFQFCRATRLYEIRRSWWLVIGVLDLLAICLVCVCVDRYRRRTKRYAFYFAHAGLVLVILGRHFTDSEATVFRHVGGQSRRGNVDSFVAKPTDQVQPFAVDEEPWRLPFELRLDRFEVDYYKQWTVTAPDPDFTNLVNEYVPRPGKRIDVKDRDGGTWKLTALEHHLSIDLDRRVVADPAGPHAAAARVRLSVPTAPMVEPSSVVLVDGHRDLRAVRLRTLADLYLRLVVAPDEAAFVRETSSAPESGEPPFGRIHVELPTGERPVVDLPRRVGASSRVAVAGGDLVFVSLAVWKNEAALARLQKGEPLPLWSQGEGNAGALVEVTQETPGEEPRPLDRVIVDRTGFQKARGEDSPLEGWTMALHRNPGEEFGDFNANLVLGPDGKASLVYREGVSTVATPLTLGADVSVGKTALVLRLEERLDRARIETKVTPIADTAQGTFHDDLDPGVLGAQRTRQLYVSATRFRVEPPSGSGEAAQEAWITSSDTWPLRFGPARSMTVALREQFGNARDYRSYVSVLDGGKQTVDRHLIQVNDPLEYRGYKVYQMRFRADEPDYSGFLVKRDRGLPWVYVGLPLTFFGIFWMLLIDPALARRRNRRRKEALA